LSLDEVVERIESVTLDELNGLMRELLAPERLSAAAIGADEDAFRSAIGPVAPDLAAQVTAG
jgi:predicted Zn-dependent peptidase